jgi:hypothetical protein
MNSLRYQYMTLLCVALAVHCEPPRLTAWSVIAVGQVCNFFSIVYFTEFHRGKDKERVPRRKAFLGVTPRLTVHSAITVGQVCTSV